LGGDLAAVETRCEQLARRRHFIQHCGIQVLPNGEAVGRYGFIHALYQNVLYDRVSPSKRVQLHRRIAERGEEVYGERAREIAAELAVHFERGRDYKRAAKYLQRAADNAIRRYAYREAVGLARHGLEVLAMMPDSLERAEQELCLQLTLGVPLTATEGYGSANVGDAYRRARELYERLGDTPDVSEVLWGLWVFCIVRAELDAAREIAQQFLRLAERLPYPGLKMRGHESMEVTLVQMGQFALALEHFEKGLALYDPEQHRDDAFLYSQNPEVAMRSHAAWALWFVGQPDEALQQMNKAITLARELSEPHGLVHVYYFGAMVHLLRREHKLAQELAEAGLAVSRKHGLVMYEAFAMIARGAAVARQGLREEGIEQMREGLAIHETTGAKLGRPQFCALLGDALMKAGQTDEALRVIEEALELAGTRGEERNLPELYRLKGELVLLRNGRVSLPKLKRVLSSRSRSRNSRKRSRGSCVRRSVLREFIESEATRKRREFSSPKSTTSSPKGSKQPICATQKRYSTIYPRLTSTPRLPVIGTLFNTRIHPFHPTFRPVQGNKTKLLVQSMCVFRRQHPPPESL
jgi:predicted ATPase